MHAPAGGDQRLDAVFSALGDSTRRGLFETLSSSPSTASELARAAPITRQAITKHLGVLEAAALVTSERDGRRVVYRATPEPLDDASAWMAGAQTAWDARIERLRRAHARRRDSNAGQ
ncbi:MAG TPA: metalloregulator ArsR/SmtB family transcription factor [Acidimicrobiia bacterium]|jgi:DNA-binding transcriptional ArsR family regulator